MKKFLFSAVALTAFSFAGMASNEVKEGESLILKDGVEKVEILRLPPDYLSSGGADPCLSAFLSVYFATRDEYGATLANSMAQAAWHTCNDAMNP